jgi:hypothetical protein
MPVVFSSGRNAESEKYGGCSLDIGFVNLYNLEAKKDLARGEWDKNDRYIPAPLPTRVWQMVKRVAR